MTQNDRLALVGHNSLPEAPSGGASSILELPPGSVENCYSLRSYWEVLSKRRSQILSVSLAMSTLVAIYSFKMRPVYRATARIEIEAEAPQIRSLNDFYRDIPTDENFLKTQVAVLQSDNLAWQTIEQLRLAEGPEFAFHGESGKTQLSQVAAKQALLTRRFKRDLLIRLLPNTRLLEVSFDSLDPQLAARVANALVNGYVEYNFHKKYDATRQASGWMEQQLDELKAKVENSQQALVDYQRAHAIVNVSDKQNVLEQRLSDLSKDLTIAESDRAQKQSLFDLVRANENQVAFLAQNELLQRLEEKYADLRAQYADARRAFGPNFPKVVRLRDQVNEIQSLIDRERGRVVDRIRSDYLAALRREKLLASAVARQKIEVGELNQLLIQHNILKREFETNQQLYDNLLQRLKDATVSAGLRADNIHVVDKALPPAVPVKPKKFLNITIGLVVGLLLGISLAFVQEGLDHSIKTVEDVEKLVAVPSLAIIPAAGPIGSRLYPFLKRKESKRRQNGTAALTTLSEPKSPLSEAYRVLRTSILFSTSPRPPQTLLITSSQPEEGKTCTSLNLGVTFAQRGGRVLIIDADMRKPGIARLLGLSNQKGLSGILTGAYDLHEALQKIEKIPNLYVLPAGPNPPNPAELLSSPSMQEALVELRQRFEHVVVDSPPLLMVTDATVLSTLVDGVILVVESGVTPRGALIRTRRTLNIAGARILGAVMNKVDLRRDGYYYGYYYRGYPYGDGQGSASQPEPTRGTSRALRSPSSID